MGHNVFDEDEPVHDWEPEPWRPPAHCPKCHSEHTRFITLQHEMSVYECGVCGTRFEIEE